MKSYRCPFHVRQGIVDKDGKFVISDICGVKKNCGDACTYIPFTDASYKTCEKYVNQMIGLEKHVLMPRQDVEYPTEFTEISQLNEIEI